MTSPNLPATAREAAIRDAFARVADATDAMYDDALAAAADLVAEHGHALALELAGVSARTDRAADPEFDGRPEDDLAGFWQRQFLRTFEIIDGQRMMGRIADKDEVYRILIIDHRTAAYARRLLDTRGWDARFVSDVRAFQDELLFSASRETPPGALLPPSDGLKPDPLDDAEVLARGPRRTEAVDRVRAAEDAWRSTLEQRTEAERAEIDRALKLDKKEHKRAAQLAEWGARAQLLADGERDAIVAALGRFDKDNAGWPSGTATETKAAVSEAIASLHDLFASLN